MAELPRSRPPDLTRLAVRRAAPGDEGELVELWRELWDHHVALAPAFALRDRDSAPWVRVVRERLCDGASAIWVAAPAAGPVQGFCVAEIERAAGPLRERQRGVITELAVRPASRRQGIATDLVDAALAWLREAGIGRVEVRVLSRNEGAQAFWRARGFGDFVDVLERRL